MRTQIIHQDDSKRAYVSVFETLLTNLVPQFDANPLGKFVLISFVRFLQKLRLVWCTSNHFQPLVDIRVPKQQMPSLVLDALSRILRLLITRSSVQITHPRSINLNCALRETQFNYAPLSGGLGCVFRGSGLHCALKGHFLYYALVNSALPLGTPTIVYFNLRMTLNYDKSKALCSQHTLGMPFRIAHHYALSNLDYIAHF